MIPIRHVVVPAVFACLVAPSLVALASAQSALFTDKKALTLAAARVVIDAAEADASRRGLGVVTVVVDEGGTLVQLSRMDAAQVGSVNVGIGKARTAALFRRPSRVFEEQIKNGRIAALALADATPLQGGVPIEVDGKVIGAVGVSGDSPQVDEEIAMAGAKALDTAGTAVTAVTLIHGVKGQEASLKDHLLSLTGPTRAEDGALRYDLFQSTSRPHEFMRFEMWASPEALDRHKQTPHLRESFERRKREGWSTEILTFTPVAEPVKK